MVDHIVDQYIVDRKSADHTVGHTVDHTVDRTVDQDKAVEH